MYRYIAPLRRSYRTTGVEPYFLVTRAEEATAVDGTTMTTASVSIDGDGSILTVFHGVGSGDSNIPTVSGWTEMGTIAGTPAGRRITTFYRAGGFSGTATIDWGGQTQSFRGYCFVDAYGLDFASLEVQEDSLSHTSSLETSTAADPLALATFDEADNTVYFAILHGGSTPNLATFDAGMTALMNRDVSAESMSLGVAWNDAEDLQPDASWTNSGHYVMQAFELRKTAVSGAVEGDGTISAIGDVSATGAKHAEGTSSVSAIGTASVTGHKEADDLAAISAIGQTSATGQENFAVTASISAIGTVTATGVKRAESAATISAVGTCTATGSALEGAGGAGSIAAIGALTVTGRKRGRASVTLSCIGTAALQGQAERTAAVVLSGLGTLVGTGGRHTSGVAAITGIGVLTVVGTTVPAADPARGPTSVSVYPSRTSILIG